MTERQNFDIVIIGAGPGGYVAAIKAAQTNQTVCLIEKNFLGGTCLNVGCIPTKTLLSNAEVLHTLKRASEFGITTGPISFDFGKMKERKDSVIEKIRKSLEGLLLSNQIKIVRGSAEFLSPNELKVKGQDSLIIGAKKIIIATGSEPLEIPSLPCDHQRVFNSTSILDVTQLPKSLVIIGGGYIGCEFASLYAELGVKVTIIEALPAILSLQGKAISDTITKAFQRKGIAIQTSQIVEGFDMKESNVEVRIKDQPTVLCDKVLIAIGRKVVSDHLGLDKAGVKVGPKGMIEVNEKMETNVPGIYAIGDVTGKFQLAHVASHQGIVAAANATGAQAQMHYNAVPSVIFTQPEIATVGMTLEQAKEAKYDAIAGKFPFQALGKSIATLETDGFAEIISDKKTGQILGATVIGHHASSLIAEMALAMANELTLECITETIHAHPTVAESWLEAALIANETPIHFPPKIKRTT